MTLGYLMLMIAAVISIRASASVHRYLFLGAMAAGGAAVNYFFMEPVHSFRVAQIGDITALSLYGVLGMCVVFHQAISVRHAPPLTVPRLPSRLRSTEESAALLDVYHFDLLVQLCAEISRKRGTAVDIRDVLKVALQRLGADSEGSSREILEDVRRQLEYEKWRASHSTGKRS